VPVNIPLLVVISLAIFFLGYGAFYIHTRLKSKRNFSTTWWSDLLKIPEKVTPITSKEYELTPSVFAISSQESYAFYKNNVFMYRFPAGANFRPAAAMSPITVWSPYDIAEISVCTTTQVGFWLPVSPINPVTKSEFKHFLLSLFKKHFSSFKQVVLYTRDPSNAFVLGDLGILGTNSDSFQVLDCSSDRVIKHPLLDLFEQAQREKDATPS